ncbi:MAG TPA: AMP-binding protein [Xanthobacteraceae bacterium]|jgi:acyl-CoA synthetase (AMP-forming)/AMP-acid ligase II
MGRDMHIAAKWRELALRHGARAAIVDGRGIWSYQEFQSRITRFGNALAGLGLRRGDRVALLVPDMREYLEADYAIMSAGFVRVPLDPRLTRAELTALLRHAGAAALVTHASFAAATDGLAGDVEGLGHIVSVGGGAGLDYEALLQRSSERPLPDGDGGELASLNFSGGTTGAPKAAMLRHRNLMAVARNTIHGFGIGGDDVFLNVRPLWPVAQVILMSYLFAGATVLLRRFDPETFATLVREEGATRTSLVPTQLVRCLDHLRDRDGRLERLEAIHVGGSRIPPAVFERALERIGAKIGVLYGLTEAPVTSYLPPRALAGEAVRGRLIQSVGRVLDDYEVRIADGDESAVVGSGRAGEVLIRGGNVMAGYWRDDSATRAALRDGWLHTGDIGELDDGGNLHIVGRLKEVIRSGSSTIVPKEVEDVIVLHPAVAEVAVIGLPDAEWGEAVTAFVVTKPGMSVAEHELVEHCRARLAGYKKPRSIRFVASLPRSHYGKVLRAQLIAQARK